MGQGEAFDADRAFFRLIGGSGGREPKLQLEAARRGRLRAAAAHSAAAWE
jgi:hypothetical protein